MSDGGVRAGHVGQGMTDADYLRAAYKAAEQSGDLSTQNGAILVDPRTGDIVSAGCNDIHAPVKDAPERRQRPLKYAFTEHAERSAILRCARFGVSTDGLVMYAPWLACADCGRAIVYAGIRKVVRHRIPEHASRPDWAASIAAADEMFREAGVEVVEHVGDLGVKFRFDGRDITA
jgi:dCMP deaminase